MHLLGQDGTKSLAAQDGRTSGGAARSKMTIGATLSVVIVVGSLIAMSSAAWGQVTDGGQVPDSVVPSGTYTAGTPFASGQNVNISVPGNSSDPVFAEGAGINIVECAYPGTLPTNPDQCDGNTIQGSTVTAGADGAISYSDYTVYSLPNSALGETACGTPVCNLSNACVLYIGENQNDFTQPHVWSQTFWVSPNSTNDGEPAGDGSAPSPSTAPSASKSTITATSTVTCPSGLSPTPSACAGANGESSATITVTLLNSSGSAVSGKTVELTGSSGSHSVISPASSGSNVSGSNGEATFKVTDSTAETVTYTATDTTDSPNVTLDSTVTVTFLSFFITTSSVPGATQGVSYSTQLQASGGVTPYKWKLIGGSLPKGLKVHSNGLLSGTPSPKKSTPGTYDFTVRAETHKTKTSPVQTATQALTLVLSS
jgi:hypothetical protein